MCCAALPLVLVNANDTSRRCPFTSYSRRCCVVVINMRLVKKSGKKLNQPRSNLVLRKQEGGVTILLAVCILHIKDELKAIACPR